MRQLGLWLTVALLFGALAAAYEPTRPTPEEARQSLSNLYYEARDGECYATLKNRVLGGSSIGVQLYVLTFTLVPMGHCR